MRALLLTLLVACTPDAAVMPDAPSDPDAALSGNGTATTQCYFWDGQTKCAPKCANRTLLGRYIFGEHNTCEYLPGRMCPTQDMTAAADSPGAGCCVVVGGEVDFYGCM